MIREGRISFNGERVALGQKVPTVRGLRVDGRPVRLPAADRHFALHKPRGVISSMSDPEGRKTIQDLMPPVKGRLFPVGRLDYGSEGLMLLTSDGQLAHRLLHPRWGVEKEYAVKLKEALGQEQLQRLRRGIFEGGERLKLEAISPLPSRSKHAWYRVLLREGKNRQIRRMMMVVRAQILRLKRVRFGSLVIGDLKVGELRPLSVYEANALHREVDPAPTAKRSPKWARARSRPSRKPTRRKTSSRGASRGRPQKENRHKPAKASRAMPEKTGHSKEMKKRSPKARSAGRAPGKAQNR